MAQFWNRGASRLEDEVLNDAPFRVGCHQSFQTLHFDSIHYGKNVSLEMMVRFVFVVSCSIVEMDKAIKTVRSP